MGLIIAALVAFGGFLAFFHALTAVAAFTCIRGNPDMAMISPDTDLLIVCMCLASAWILAYFQKDIFAFRGVGTKMYGREQNEEGYIATKWLTAIFPLMPIRSYVISYEFKEIASPDVELQRNSMQPFESYFHLPQMLRTALISYGTIAWSLGCLWVMFIGACI